MTKLKAIFVDDETEKRDPQRIKTILDNADIDCELMPPPKFSEINNLGCDIFITDLNLAQAKLDQMTYSGKTLSSEYRLNFPSTPILLITQKEIIAAKAKNLRTDNTDFDLIWYKRDAWEKKDQFIREIKSLISGFHSLSSSQLDWSGIQDVMKTGSGEEYNQLREANPPIHRDNWTISEIAEWIRSTVIQFPGVLLDDCHAAVRIGMNPDDFASDSDLHQLFEDAQYTGVFHEFGRRWWKNRFLEIASEFILEHDSSQSVLSGFVPVFNSVYNKDLQHSYCIWDEKPIAETMCYILHQPVKLRNSLLYRPDNRPSIMEAARVSRTAIVGSNEFDELLLDPGSVSTANQWMKEV